jgi:hypothetical protein
VKEERAKLKSQDEDGMENHNSQHWDRMRVHRQRKWWGINEATTQTETFTLTSTSQPINVPIELYYSRRWSQRTFAYNYSRNCWYWKFLFNWG